METEKGHAYNYKDVIGIKFGKLTVIDQFVVKKKKSVSWLVCVCDCGGEKTAAKANVLGGKTTSCGCVALERQHKKKPNRKCKHGMYGTPEYRAWNAMRQRCFNPKVSEYHRYGGRGITISKEWVESFSNFYNDMGSKPSMGHSIDRINNNGNYCKENCKWSTRKEQQNNMSTNKPKN